MVTRRRPKVFISRTTAGLKDIADEIAAIVRSRGAEPVVQSDFLPDWRSVPQMLQDKLIGCDAVIALIGPCYGSEPEREPARLNDPRTHGRRFSFTQWEYLVARHLRRPLFTFIVSGPDLVSEYEEESDSSVQSQQFFIEQFARDKTNLYYEYSSRAKLLSDVAELALPINISAGRPHNLPEPIGPLFKGRHAFIESLRRRLLDEDCAVISSKQHTIYGMGGVGKTRAAVEYAWIYADSYNALLFVTADSKSALDRNLAALAGPLVLNLPEQDAREINLQFAAVIRWLSQNPGWLLIIDNADTPESITATRALCAQIPFGHVLITSRRSDWPTSLASVDLDVLDSTASVELLIDHTTGRRIERADDGLAALEIARAVDGLALALEQIAAVIRATRGTFADYITQWNKVNVALLEEYNRRGLDDYHSEGTDLPRSLYVTFATSIAQLSATARQLFDILSWLAPDALPIAFVERIPSLPNARTALIELADLSLVRLESAGGFCRLHRIVQEIRRQEQSPAVPPPALMRTLEWIFRVFPYEADDARNWAIAIPLVPHVIATAEFAILHKIYNPSTSLLNGAAVLLLERGDYELAERLVRRCLEFVDISKASAKATTATYKGNLAQILRATGRLDEAEILMREVLAVHEVYSAVNGPEVLSALNNLSTLLVLMGRVGEAEPLARRALSIAETVYGPEHDDTSLHIHNLAALLLETGRLAAAEPLIRRALQIDERSVGQEHPNVATDLNNLCALLCELGRHREAEPFGRRALQIDEAQYGNEHPSVARDLGNLATALAKTTPSEAESMAQRALQIYEKVLGPHHQEVGMALLNMSGFLQDRLDYSSAEPLLRRALAIFEGNLGPVHPTVGVALNNLACLLERTDRAGDAQQLRRRSIGIFIEFRRQSGHDHPKFQASVRSYAHSLKMLGETQFGIEKNIDMLFKQHGFARNF